MSETACEVEGESTMSSMHRKFIRSFIRWCVGMYIDWCERIWDAREIGPLSTQQGSSVELAAHDIRAVIFAMFYEKV